MEVVPVKCVTAWCWKPMNPTTLTQPPMKARIQATVHYHRGNLETMAGKVDLFAGEPRGFSEKTEHHSSGRQISLYRRHQ